MTFTPRDARDGEQSFILRGDDPLTPQFVDAYRLMIQGEVLQAQSTLGAMSTVIEPLPPGDEKVISCARFSEDARRRQHELAIGNHETEYGVHGWCYDMTKMPEQSDGVIVSDAVCGTLFASFDLDEDGWQFIEGESGSLVECVKPYAWRFFSMPEAELPDGFEPSVQLRKYTDTSKVKVRDNGRL